MADTTAIEWTDATVNFWWGCMKVSPGCDHCYAEDIDKVFGGPTKPHWGPRAPYRRIEGAAKQLRQINDKAGSFRTRHGHLPRVMCMSMGDILDAAAPPVWRKSAHLDMARAKDCHIIAITKRIGNHGEFHMSLRSERQSRRDRMWYPQNVGWLITVTSQAEADRDIDKLIHLKKFHGIRWVGLSVEPMLGCIVLRDEWLRHLDWVIIGGESGPKARPFMIGDAMALADQCLDAGVALFVKQLGRRPLGPAGNDWPVSDRKGGNLDDFPAALRHRQFPGAIAA